MVSANDPVESFFNSIQHVKNVIAPLEFGIRKAAKDFEHCWPGSKNGVNSLELVMGQVNVVGHRNGSKVQTCSAKKKNRQCMVSEERKKGLLKKVPIKTFLGMFSQNCANNGQKVELFKKASEERDCVKEEGTCTNCLQFAVTWSLFINGFVQAFPSPFKTGKRWFQKTTNEDKACVHSCADASKPRVSCGIQRKESNGQPVLVFLDELLKDKEGKNLSLECFIGFVFDHITQNLQMFDLGAQESELKSSDSSPLSPPFNHFDHFKSVTSIWEGKKGDASGILGNFKFARVGGVPSSMVGVTSPVNEETDDVTTASQEESGGNSTQKLANGLLSIPLSNVERLRSTLSTVSLTELIELVPHLGRSSKDYPDKKKLFSVQDFFRYTETEGMCLRFLGNLFNIFSILQSIT